MQLRARREKALANVIERLAQLLIGRFAPICHVIGIDGSASSYASTWHKAATPANHTLKPLPPVAQVGWASVPQ